MQCAAASCPEPLTLGGGRSPRAAAWRFLHASSPASAVPLLSPSPCSPVPPPPPRVLPETGREGVGPTPPPLQPTLCFSFDSWFSGFTADSLQPEQEGTCLVPSGFTRVWSAGGRLCWRGRGRGSSGPQRADSSIKRKLGRESPFPLPMAVTGYQGTSSGHLLFVLHSLPACGLTYDLAKRHRLSQAGPEHCPWLVSTACLQ